MITNQIYPIALLLSIGKRTCESMGKQAELSGDTILRMLDKSTTIEEKCAIVNQFFNGKKLDALVDDVLLEKRYAKQIEGISFQRNTYQHIRHVELFALSLSWLVMVNITYQSHINFGSKKKRPILIIKQNMQLQKS